MILIRAALTLLALAALAAIDAPPSVAEVYRRWCVDYPPIGTSCVFTSFEQCMMTAGPGTGGSCVQNPWYFAYGEGRKSGPAARGKRIRHE
jgi:Protein of unknown function (DUF3551)